MLSRKSLLTTLAVVLPVGVYALTVFTEPADSETPASELALRSDNSDAEEPSHHDLLRPAGDAVPVVATASPEQTGAKSARVIEAFTEPYRDIAVAASEMGTLSEIKVREGDVVRQGDVLAVMSDEVLRASLEVARRTMSVEGVVQSAQADLDRKTAERAKLQELRERDHASQQELDRIETELRVAEARLLSVREDLEVKQLEFRRIEAQLEQRKVRAPMDGVISKLWREAGEYVSPSEPKIVRLVQLDPLLIEFSVPLERRSEVRKDQVVTLKITAAGTTAEGIVEFVSQTSDESNSSVRVRVRLPNPNQAYHSGERTVLIMDTATNPTPAAAQQASTPLAQREQ